MPIPAWAWAASLGLQGAGDILGGIGGGGGDYEGGSAIGRPEWWQQQAGLGEGATRATQFAQQITPEYMGHLRSAISGEMGLSPQMLQMMGGRVKQQMAPQFAMQQDVMKSSFNPRLAGSGAMASAMQKLLGGQSQQMTGAQTDINIQDLFQRSGAQRQALGQYGSLWGGAQGAQLGQSSALLRWLGM